ncbi:MAG: 1-(5-phosphoribosyl)-5-[(5-phosphoribosylamino)methylideneamino]imidazole-4-carboxamide isomerase [Chloroflexi bacterium]|nr:1-(5-phosphoribosyl)-5-[(5-phosphoribosylamino)methylideneamino]imidazole-4-carboxamide isomerase [Chloroflexota bacterium]
MLVIPAIDLKGGRCVRLVQGDYSNVTVFSDDPVETAQRWQAAGATWLHVVDLDGAKAGAPVNVDVVGQICAQTTLRVELGGGIRDLAGVARVFASGVERAVLGTAAVRDPEFLAAALRAHGEKIAVGIDARGGKVAVQGWTVTTERLAVDVARAVGELGTQWIIYTDIERDGTLTQPNYEATTELARSVPANVIASGGVAKLDHLLKLRELGVVAAIVGRAIYTGAIDLKEAIDACQTDHSLS